MGGQWFSSDIKNLHKVNDVVTGTGQAGRWNRVTLYTESVEEPDMNAYFLAPPRTYGATLRYDF
jgi:hypothetical protein